MSTPGQGDIVVPWEIVEEAAPTSPPAPGPTATRSRAGGAGIGTELDHREIDHCPACSSRLVEVSVADQEPEVRCLSCARVWSVGPDGLVFRERRVVEP